MPHSKKRSASGAKAARRESGRTALKPLRARSVDGPVGKRGLSFGAYLRGEGSATERRKFEHVATVNVPAVADGVVRALQEHIDRVTATAKQAGEMLDAAKRDADYLRSRLNDMDPFEAVAYLSDRPLVLAFLPGAQARSAARMPRERPLRKLVKELVRRNPGISTEHDLLVALKARPAYEVEVDDIDGTVTVGTGNPSRISGLKSLLGRVRDELELPKMPTGRPPKNRIDR